MPAYSYECQICHDIAGEIYPIGRAPRNRRCQACGGLSRLRIGDGVQIAPSALENKGEGVRAIDLKERRWNRDMPAYQRMRHKGMQPRAIDGAAALEDQVGDNFDVHYKPLLDQGISRKRIQESHEQAQEIVESAGMDWNGPA